MKSSNRTMDILALVMLLYQGWRVMDYMQSNLADVPTLTRLIVSLAFLVFTEVALWVWLHKGRTQATTSTQEFTATMMVWADFVLSMIIGLGDLIVHNRFYVVDLSLIDPLLFAAPWVSVVLNIGAYIVYHMADSHQQLEAAERQLLHAEHQLEISARLEAIRLLGHGKQALAEQLAPHYTKRIEGNVTGRTLARFVQAAGQDNQPPTLPSETTKPVELVHTPGMNGKAHDGEITNRQIFPNQRGGCGDGCGCPRTASGACATNTRRAKRWNSAARKCATKAGYVP